MAQKSQKLSSKLTVSFFGIKAEAEGRVGIAALLAIAGLVFAARLMGLV
jgi:hypothetical protein